MKRPRKHRIDAAGVGLRVLEDGPVDPASERPPVVVLHGFTGDAQTMRVAVDALAAERRVLRVELIGHGASDAPRERAPYRMQACVEQLVALCEALELERPHWLGYSMGGRTALCTAAVHPERVRSLSLIGASAGLADPEARAARVRADEALADRIESEGVEAFVDHWMALPLFASQKRLGEAALSAARRQRLANRAHGLAQSLRGMGTGAQPALQTRLAQIGLPVALFVGDEDTKFMAIADELAAALPVARVVGIPEAGHAAHLENPEAFGRALRAFVNEVER